MTVFPQKQQANLRDDCLSACKTAIRYIDGYLDGSFSAYTAEKSVSDLYNKLDALGYETEDEHDVIIYTLIASTQLLRATSHHTKIDDEFLADLLNNRNKLAEIARLEIRKEL